MQGARGPEARAGRRAFLKWGAGALSSAVLACNTTPTPASRPGEREAGNAMQEQHDFSQRLLAYWLGHDVFRYGLHIQRDRSRQDNVTLPDSPVRVKTYTNGTLGQRDEIPVTVEHRYAASGYMGSRISLNFENSAELRAMSTDFVRKQPAVFGQLQDIAGTERIVRSVFNHMPQKLDFKEGKGTLPELHIPVLVPFLEARFSLGEYAIQVKVTDNFEAELVQEPLSSQPPIPKPANK